jgi:hypothetical protein
MIDDLTVAEARAILHASGLSQSTRQYRDHYCCRPDNVMLNKLVSEGYFRGPVESLSSFNAMFYLTSKGIGAARDLADRFNSFQCNCIGKDEEE